MTHEEARTRWHEVSDDGGRDVELEAHLAECAPCRAYVREMESVLRVLDVARADTDDLHLEGERHELSHESYVFGESIHRAGAWLRVAAAIGIVIGACYWLTNGRNDSTEFGNVPTVVATPVSGATFGVTMRGESAARRLVVADSASTEEVQVYWIYPSLARKGANAERDDGESENSTG